MPELALEPEAATGLSPSRLPMAPLAVSEPEALSLSPPGPDSTVLAASDPESLALTVSESVVEVDLPWYDGDCEVTPTREAQVLATSGRAMSSDVTVAPIPSNYGLITWNGSYITVT